MERYIEGCYRELIIPSFQRVVVRTGQTLFSPHYFTYVMLWLWAVLFRYHGQFATFPDVARAQATEMALRLTCNTALEAMLDAGDKQKLFKLARTEGFSKAEAIASTQQVLQRRAAPFFAACLDEARKLPGDHSDFDAMGFFRAYDKYRRLASAPELIHGKVGDDDARVMTLLAAQGQALLYSLVTGIAVPGDLVPTQLQHLDGPCDVFISYAREDGIKAGLVNTTLRHFGIASWMDSNLESAKRFDAQINAKIRGARAIVVLWSRHSVESRWVQAEAMVGFERDNLVPLLLEACDVPVPMNLIQAFDFRDWDGDEKHPQWLRVRSALEARVGLSKLS